MNLLILRSFSSQNTKLFMLYNVSTSILFCGTEGNRTLHTLIANQNRQPWYMRALIFVEQMRIELTPKSLPGILASLGTCCPIYFERVAGIEPASPVWKTRVITTIRYPRFFTSWWDGFLRVFHLLWSLPDSNLLVMSELL